ncbi:hypothetical protein [Methanimicrococcus blatticola]|nr:hypothetical protein [Methanimicrococcus blatticola]
MTGRADCHIFTSRFLSFVPDSEIHKIVEKAMDDTLDDVRSHYFRTHPDPMNGYAVLRIQVSDEMMNYFMSRKLKCE